ncbi:MAG: hypothetical protein M1833_000697 [Piccolia ochrophora]|nr:MAG: hypothetical protein M1833_000697 [Piccolia ochrophora]
MAYLFGRATTTFHHALDTLPITTNSGKPSTLVEICRAATPPCFLNPLLFNGHLQTLRTVTSNQDIPVYYKRKVFDADTPAFGGTFAVDFVVDEYPEQDESLPPRTTFFSNAELEKFGSLDSKPMVVVLHGLSGGSHEGYLRSVLETLITPDGGFEACVVNSRGCALSKITSPVLYNARATWDLRQVVKWLQQQFPNRPLFGLGFSLGANILTNYLGEEGEPCALKAAVVCSNPWNLEVSSVGHKRTWLGLHVYSRGMATNMKALIEKHADQISQNPQINMEKLRNTRFLFEFDREIQCPTWGYPTENAYYRDASSSDALLSVRIPLFAINARDDPIAIEEALPLQEIGVSPYVVLCLTSHGGHLGWFESGGGRWFAKPAANFLKKMATEVDLDLLGKTQPATGEDGGVRLTSPSTGKYRDWNAMRRRMDMFPHNA